MTEGWKGYHDHSAGGNEGFNISSRSDNSIVKNKLIKPLDEVAMVQLRWQRYDAIQTILDPISMLDGLHVLGRDTNE